MYRLATCFWVCLRTLSPQGLSIAPKIREISATYKVAIDNQNREIRG